MNRIQSPYYRNINLRFHDDEQQFIVLSCARFHFIAQFHRYTVLATIEIDGRFWCCALIVSHQRQVFGD